jgi:hypothetical protein
MRGQGLARAWQFLRIGLLAAALALAGFLLYRTLGRYELEELVRSVRAVSGSKLLLAGLFAAAGYLCQTLFDWLGLRYAGRPLAFRRAALASFVSLSIGHNLGFAALSSGAIRYRFYSRWGLDGPEVARVILFCGITVGLGLAALGGIAILLRPDLAQDMLRVERPVVLGVGGAFLAFPAAWLCLAATLRRPLGLGRWSLRMPTLRLAAAQLALGPLNFAFVAASLHQTISAVADLPYLATACVYVIGNIATLVTHVPGGLGIIESAVIFLLPHADLIGAVLVFRFVYFLVPLGVGSALFAAAELRWRSGAAAARSRN